MTKNRFFCSIFMVFTLIFLLVGCEGSSAGQIITADAQPEKAASGETKDGSLIEKEENEEVQASREGWTFYKSAGKTGVYIYGAVNNPGVYYLNSNARVVDLVEAAGGFKKNACKTGVNLAAYLKDADVVRILTKKQAKRLKKDEYVQQENSTGQPLDEKMSSDGTVNINLAGKEELMSLDGIGQSKAEAIIAYREEHGSFKSVEEIMEISGIKEGTFNKIKSKITI